jgi:hypothetical protein
MNLPKQSFLALAAIGWADGALERSESTGLLRAAKEAGLSGEDFAEVERAVTNKTTLDAIDVSSMTPWDQVLTYALAAWFAQLDGIVSESEKGPLNDLGDRLGLGAPLRVRAAAAANDIACLPGGGKPERYDFQKLGARLRERLPQVK